MVKLEVAFVSKYFDYVDSRPPTHQIRLDFSQLHVC